jgi:C-terminal processing protease CtpA/Prc
VQENGEYDGYEDSEAFAQRLTDDMLAISGDKHVNIIFSEPPPRRNDGYAHDDDDEQGRGNPENFFDELRRINFGFGISSMETIQDKRVGYLPINGFVPSSPDIASDSASIRRKIGEIISSVADADALVIDLRNNGGGHPDTVAFVVSYFVDGDAPIHLNDMVDRQGTVKYSYSTLPASGLPEGTVRFGGSKPLFVLTSRDTVSGGEEMVYDLQALKRTHAIIGDGAETTAGAANPVMNVKSICADEFGKNWWVAAVPDMRPVNGVTGTNWEGVGVKSDVVVGKGDDAKALARRMAMEVLGLDDTGVSAQA